MSWIYAGSIRSIVEADQVECETKEDEVDFDKTEQVVNKSIISFGVCSSQRLVRSRRNLRTVVLLAFNLIFSATTPTLSGRLPALAAITLRPDKHDSETQQL
jgi:hypothetical protein